VGNAVKYSPPASAIDGVVQRCGAGASVSVQDRGFGISEDEANRIFERFYRSDRTSRLASGAGLGLAVCKRLVEAMSGRIWATPREGGGLEVGFSLPPYHEEAKEE
jgi:two-component system sensor histidine kinase KdpD